MVKGKGASKGIGIGHTKVLKNEEVKLTDFKVDDKENELNYFRKCLNNVIEDTDRAIKTAIHALRNLIKKDKENR